MTDNKSVEVFSLEDLGRRYKLHIPPIQRGLVWNAVQTEVLWDSILRGFPIGTFSLKKKDGDDEYDLLDGQQRTNAISLGFAFADLPSKDDMAKARVALKSGKEYDNLPECVVKAMKPVLWIDLVPSRDDEKLSRAKRKFYFKVTTAAHPWGYGNSDDEKNNDRFNADKIRNAFDTYCEKCRKSSSSIEPKPFPYEFWPFEKTGMPIPLCIIVHYLIKEVKEGCPSFEDFINWCDGRPEIREANWYQFNLPRGDDKLIADNWVELVCAIRERVKNYKVVGIIAQNINDDDIGLLFERMNKNGTVPDDEEIQYSLVKDKLRNHVTRDTWERLDKYASRLGISGSNLLNIILRYLIGISDKENSLPGQNLSTAKVLAFADYLRDFLCRCDNGAFDLLDRAFNEYRPYGMVMNWLLAEIAGNSHGVLLVYILRVISDNILQSSKLKIPGLASCILWFSKNLEKVVKDMWSCGADYKSGLYIALSRTDGMTMPAKLKDVEEYFNSICTAENLEQMEQSFVKKDTNPNLISLRNVWHGFNGQASHFGKSLLLWGCRKYLSRVFLGYEPGQPQWYEQCTPWDYDHLLPKAWLEEAACPERFKIYESVVMSIGNSAPVQFQLNRARGKNELQRSYPYQDSKGGCDKDFKDLHLDCIDISAFKKGEGLVDDRQWFSESTSKSKNRILSFCKNVCKRFYSLYENWYDELGIADLFELEECDAYKNDFRRLVFEALRRDYIKDCQAYYWVDGNSEFELGNAPAWRWAMPWISFGRLIKKEGQPKALIGVAIDGHSEKWEYGIRKSYNDVTADQDFGKELLKLIEEKNGPAAGFINKDWWYFYRRKTLSTNPSDTARSLYECVKEYLHIFKEFL